MGDLESSTGERQTPERKARSFKKLYLNPGIYGVPTNEVEPVEDDVFMVSIDQPMLSV